MKKSAFFAVVSLLMAGVCALGTACGEKNNIICVEPKGKSQNLSYELHPNGDSYVLTGRGGCTDSHIIVPDTHNGLPVTEIAREAFYGDSYLLDLTLGKNIVWISDDAFTRTGYYTNEENWKDGTLYAGDCLLAAKGLTGDYAVKDGTRVIAEWAFNSQFSLDSVDPIYNEIDSISVPDSVVSLGHTGTDYWSITGAKNVNRIGFYDASLTEEDIEATRWENGGLYVGACLVGVNSSCGDTLVVKDGTRGISPNLYYPEDVKKIVIPASVEYIVADRFSASYFEVNEKNPHYKSVDGSLYTKDGKSLLRCTPPETPTAFTVPDGVVSVWDYAFEGCTQLTGVTIPDSVQKIGRYAFADCENLSDIKIGNGVISIGRYAFNGVAYTDGVDDGVDYIGNYLVGASRDFSGALKVKDGTRVIADEVFADIGGSVFTFSSVEIPDSVVAIGENAFNGCMWIEQVKIGNGVKEIGDLAFAHCLDLTQLTLGDSVEIIGAAAFSGCPLENVYIPASVKTIGSNAFSEGLKIEVDEKNAYYKCVDGNFYTQDGKILLEYLNTDAETFVVPDGVEAIGDRAGIASNKLTKVIFCDGLLAIGLLAFDTMQGVTVEIPESVRAIDINSFSQMNGVIRYNGTKAEWYDLCGELVMSMMNAQVICSDGEIVKE